MSTTEKVERAQAKEYEKVLKACCKFFFSDLTILTCMQTVSDPLKEGRHFEQNLGGIAGLFENLRSNTQVGGLGFAFEVQEY